MKKKEYWELTSEELEAVTKEFDEPFVFEKTRPLTASEKKRWQRVRRKRRRAKPGKA